MNTLNADHIISRFFIIENLCKSTLSEAIDTSDEFSDNHFETWAS